MTIKVFALIVYLAIPFQWNPSSGEVLSCTPQMTNISVPLSKHRPSENISSPTTFPSNQSVYCSWNISVPVGKRIRIHFTSFHLAKSANCSISAVELIEKKGLISTATGRYCGRDTPNDVLSSSSSLSVIYLATNGCTLNHTGFQAFVSLAPEETCSPYNHPDTNYNIELNGLTGRLSSSWFPSEYRINMKCRWIITVPTGNRIKLSFQIFDLGATATGQENCDKVDHVEIRDSFNDADPGYGTFCGDEAPAPIYSVGPKMVVTFVSDQETIFQGFEARFDAITGGVCTDNNRFIQLNLTHNSTGRISSPDYPLQYAAVSACYFRLHAPEGYRIKLDFTTLNIAENCEHEQRRSEWIRVDDVFTTDFNSVASYWGTFCGQVQPPVIYSTRNELQIFFTSNYTSNEADRNAHQRQTIDSLGFYAIFGVTPQVHTSRCRTDLMDNSISIQSHTGSIVSPGYPHSYPIITCTWNIKVPDGYILEVTIKDFEMDCTGGSKLIVGEDSFCGSDKPYGVLSSEMDMKIQMIATKAKDNSGFLATFSMAEQEIDIASIIPWIVIPIVVAAVGVTMFIMWRRRTTGFDHRSSFKSSIINRMRTQSSVSQA
ncbi:tolloid-like protein 2 isoform X1 [Montipora capricornis]|uniref:tolloid-like protein 2 isoform X1 n=2 Tax=Montipora foliosa TaxID=591990 RepID=UPI0035F195B2